MKWNLLLQKIFFRINRSDQKIVDGVLVHDPSKPSKSGQIESSESDQTESSEFNTVKHDEPREPVFYPITIPQYAPMYPVDPEPGGDLGLFYHWLQTNRYRALKAYISDIGVWRERLSGHIDSDEILRVIGEYLPNRLTRAKRMMYTLKVYSQYRYDFGDPRIAMILAIDERKFKLPNPRKDKFNIALSPGRIEMLNTQAKALCTEGDRAGIWLGLLIRGIPASAVETVEITDNQVRYKNWTKWEVLRIPDWLRLSMTDRISEKIWRRNRVTVKNRVSHYETPKVLYKNAAVAISVLGE